MTYVEARLACYLAWQQQDMQIPLELWDVLDDRLDSTQRDEGVRGRQPIVERDTAPQDSGPCP